MSDIQPESHAQGDVNSSGIATVGNRRINDIPLRNLSCFMAAHNPLNGMENAPPLTWDDHRLKFVPIAPADWARELMAKNLTRRQHDEFVRTMLRGIKAITDLLDADPPPQPPMFARDHQLETRHAYILGWLEEFRRYAIAAHESGQIFADKISKLVDSIQAHHEAMVGERAVLLRMEAALNAGEKISMEELEKCTRAFEEHSAALDRDSEELKTI
ncbi:hypothetical protein AURDEDRAFT_131264 [Auricularia subglabra TFB-10046 SS5]|uniref:Uncharacterized protein n=1 Tax=Auricularia subglabra (strain TFB-10046 / SS5) TaxID=717982 RepID=J0WQS7_AURST|nr:hypothetical protein AURDEDRAFT_131264 [Auricularia subglabra TFB-10046 SS5]